MIKMNEYFTKDFQKVLEGKDTKTLKKLQRQFAKDRLIDIEKVLSPAGLKKLKTSFDKLKNKEEYSEEKHKKISGIDAIHVEKEPFVSLLLKSEEFRLFLAKLTQFEDLHIRKSKRANINISTDTGHFYEWHFDGHGITVIFPLDSPKKGNGGEFAYYPNFRKVGAGFFNRALTKVLFMAKMHDFFFKKKILRYTPGNLVVFDGDTTMHAALPLSKKDYRRIVILHYVKD